MSSKQPSLPPDVDEVLGPLINDMGRLHYMWAAYNELHQDHDSVDAMNAAAPEAFNLFRFALQREIIMSICRLCDPAAQGPKGTFQNLTLGTLINTVRSGDHCSQCFSLLLEADLDGIRSRLEPLKRERDKRLGHTDLQRRLAQSQRWLPGITSQLIAKLITHINTLVDLMRENLAPGTSCYWIPTSGARHARRLVEVVQDGLRHRSSCTAACQTP